MAPDKAMYQIEAQKRRRERERLAKEKEAEIKKAKEINAVFAKRYTEPHRDDGKYHTPTYRR